MAFVLPADRQVEVQVSYVDANGNPAVVDGDVSWSSSDEQIATVIVNASNTTIATVRPATNIGNVQVSAVADADLGAGVRELVTLLDVTVVGGEAVAGTITPTGEAVPIPPQTRRR